MRSGIPPSVVEVRTALALLVEISAGVQATSKLTRQISTMQEDQARFAASLAQACNAASHAFDPARLAVCADELDAALTAAQQTQALARDKARALAQAHVDRQTLKGDVQLLSAQRNVMCARYGVDTIALLRDALDDAAKATRLAQEIVMLETELLAALCVPGLAVALARLEGMDLAALQAEADRLEREQTAADSDIQTLHHANRTARQAFDSIGADGRVAALMENRRTTMLEIGDTATRYLRLRLGAEAIDSALRAYRDRHRSGMLRDAALRFTHITGGSFSDLRTQMSDKGETLVGVQQGGGSLLADAMSKGTRDQLFLALRMAGYLEFAKSREPLPFIADDVMETFDDTRASATFGMLAQIARHGQVIYLTHHEHLCDLARKACGDGVHIMRF